jgi:transglutaminase-like putative cysteine protease
MVTFSWLLAVVVIAAIFPYVRFRQASRAFWQIMDRPYTAVEKATTRLFGQIEDRYPGGPGLGELPRDHLLGGRPDLGQQIALTVTTSDPPPPPPESNEPAAPLPGAPRRYWRSGVYDVYTGHGWEHGPLESRSYRGDQPLDVTPLPGPELQQEFDIVRRETGEHSLYMVNEPLVLDQPVEAWWQSPGDLAYVQGDARRYSVISRPAEPSVADLRAAPATLPPEVAGRYLAVPESLPKRVRDLAAQLAASGTTRYDQASAIESYLRTYTYTLDLPAPPTDRDVVDYFLFDLKKGYCDYYASAMVVMARAVGIPARFAVGYAQGTYDYEQHHWVATELDAHSWVEIYFDGIGWVEFEPTAGQPALQRLVGQSGPPTTAGPAATAGSARIPWPLLSLPVVLALLIGVVLAIWLPRRAAAMPAGELARDRYRRLVRWGARLGRPPREGETPFEYGATLGEALRQRGHSSRWARTREAAAQAPGEVQELTEGFVRSQYAPRPLEEREGRHLSTVWERLRAHLRWLLLR